MQDLKMKKSIKFPWKWAKSSFKILKNSMNLIEWPYRQNIDVAVAWNNNFEVSVFHAQI